MDYFTDVYLKRINQYGETAQDRIHGRMECDFENKLRKSVNKVELYNDDLQKIGIGILETKKITEKETVDYLLTRVSDTYENGFIFKTQKPFSEEYQTWMVIFKEQYQTIGYNRYIVVLLENSIEWISEGLVHSSYAHYIGSMNGKIKDLFKISNNVAVGEPNKILTMVCPFTKALKRDLKINISDETWRVCGYDKISVPGVMYVTLEEDYIQNTKLANEEELNNWSIISNQGLDIVVSNKEPVIEFYCSYNGGLTNEEVELKCDNNEVIIENVGFNKYCIGGPAITGEIIATLKNTNKVLQVFSLTITEQQENWLAIVGPNQIKVLQTLEYKLATSLLDYTVEIKSEKDCFKIDRIDGDKVYLQGINIGQDNILITHNGVTYSTPINVVSSWM